MNIKHWLNDAALNYSVLPGCFRSGGAKEYVARGKEIPDYLLPGRAMMNMGAETRAKLIGLTSADMADVSDWWIKIMCGD